MAQMQSCDELWDMLSAYADNMVTPDESLRVERHVAICSDCARDLRFMRETASVLVNVPEVVPPASLRESILAATIYKPTRPTLQERLREAGRKLVPNLPLRALAFAGSAAAILLVAYVTSTRAPQDTAVPGASPQVASSSNSSLPIVKQPTVIANSDTPKTNISDAKSSNSKAALAPDSSEELTLPDVEATTPAPRIVEASHRSRSAAEQSLRQRAEGAIRARADMAGRAARVSVASGRTGSGIAPSLQPERSVQPNDMLAQPSITMADIKTPMVAANTDSTATTPMHDMTHTDTSTTTAPPAPDKGRISLASNVTQPGPSNSMMTLADLRRQLRRQNNEFSSAAHPEFKLRPGRETLDVVKSTF